jgi:hypothetical protein
MNLNSPFIPGPIALFGSGETAPSGQKIFDFLFKLMPDSPRVSIIETPAGFELNSEQVAGNVAQFIQKHLQNYKPDIKLIPARKKNTAFSPDDPDISLPVLESEMIFMGPGSPTYAVNQLKDSLVWEYLLVRHRQGAGLALSSATTVAISAAALPVYEIYKVGEDLHWKDGLNFFLPYQLPLVFIPHWNNQDGGKDLDTSRCYMGKSRFDELMNRLPQDQIIIGIDEHTGLIFDFKSECLHVIGLGTVTILRDGAEEVICTGCSIDLSDLGEFDLCDPLDGISEVSWQKGLDIQTVKGETEKPSPDLVQLAERRESARLDKDWGTADKLRIEIEDQGWIIQDNPDGYSLQKK